MVAENVFGRSGAFVGCDDIEVLVEVLVEIVKRVDVKSIFFWLSGKLAEAMAKHLLQFIGKIRLGTEEDHFALRDCERTLNDQDTRYHGAVGRERASWYILVTASSFSILSEFGPFIQSTTLASVNSVPMIGVTSFDLKASSKPVSFIVSLLKVGLVGSEDDISAVKDSGSEVKD